VDVDVAVHALRLFRPYDFAIIQSAEANQPRNKSQNSHVQNGIFPFQRQLVTIEYIPEAGVVYTLFGSDSHTTVCPCSALVMTVFTF